MGMSDWATRALVAASRPRVTGDLELRAAPHVLASPVQWTAPGQEQVPVWNGQLAVDSAYLGNLYVFRCLEAMANAISMTPFRAVLNPEEPMKFATGQYSQLAKLLSPPPGSPNPQWTPRQLWKYTVLQYFITGKWAWRNEFDSSGNIIGLWPIPAQHVYPVPVAPGSRGDKYFSEYIYHIQGQRIRIPEKDLTYCWNPSQSDFLQPESVLKAGSYRIGLLQMLDRYDQALAKNNFVGTTIVTTEPFATGDDRREFRKQFVSSFSGYDNAGKTLFLEADADIGSDGSTSNNVAGKVSVERLAMTPVESQAIEQYRQVIEDILVMTGTPKSVLGVAMGETFNNSGIELRNWWNERLLPIMADMQDQVNVKLAPKLGRHVGIFDTSKVKALQPDKRFQPADIAVMVKPDATANGPVLTRDEARAELGLAPWADVEHPEETEAVVAPPAGDPQVQEPSSPPKLTVVKDEQPTAKKMLQRQLESCLREQRSVLITREGSRKGRKVESRADLMDAEWHLMKAVEALSPSLSYLGIRESRVISVCKQLVEDTSNRLSVCKTVAVAFEDIESRAIALADRLVRDAERVPVDHIAVLLAAVASGKISAATVADLWEAV